MINIRVEISILQIAKRQIADRYSCSFNQKMIQPYKPIKIVDSLWFASSYVLE